MPSRRPPLGEATQRVNNHQDRGDPSRAKNTPSLPHHESRRPGGLVQNQGHPQRPPTFDLAAYNKENGFAPPRSTMRPPKPISKPIPKPLPENYNGESKRHSHASSTSTGSDGTKKAVGPWTLGKTLGEGATARVRKARNMHSGEVVACKIIQKKDAKMTQAGSLAALDRMDTMLAGKDGNKHRIPVGIEREIAIMKLISHPHVISLIDIWENRNEIYLVMEYVDKGELFDYISSKGRLREPEGMKFWRQILSALGYCHSLNICHRDLKPENILLTHDGNIKIADFGMAALRQTRSHQLDTSCGSPHYAAPEIISGMRYSGDKVDIWSMGIILYAILAGTLPFDHPGPGLAGLLNQVRRGQYKMSPHFSAHARDLIARILRLSPHERPSIRQIWQHPLLRQYDYLDGLSMADKDDSTDKNFERVKRVSDIDVNVLRYLRTMWHTFTEAQLVECLLSERPNEQQKIYSMIKSFRGDQLENYSSRDMDYSNSDYHHVRPLNEIRKLSTRHFYQPSKDGGVQKVSSFTVYGPGLKDPDEDFSESRARKETPNDGNHLKIPRLNNDRRVSADRKPSGGGLMPPQGRAFQTSPSPSSSSINHTRPPARRGFHTRSSLASSTRSRMSTSGGVKPRVGHKPGVTFPHQKVSNHGVRGPSGAKAPDDPFIEAGAMTSDLHSEQYIRSKKSKKTTGALLQPMLKRRSKRNSRFWEDDVRRVSTSLEKDCNMAFNLEKAASLRAAGNGFDIRSKFGSGFSSFQQDDPAIESSPRLPHNLQAKSGKAWWDQRPLPRPPGRTDSVDAELREARKNAEIRRASGNPEVRPGYLDQMITHIDHLIEPNPSPSRPPTDRRVVSAPAPRKGDRQSVLGSIEESSLDGRHQGSHLDSQAVPKFAPDESHENWYGEYARSFQKGIRIVPPSSPSPIKPIAPLKIKKQDPKKGPPALMTGALGADVYQQKQTHHKKLRQSQNASTRSKDLPRIDECDSVVSENNSNGTIRHKASWYKRSSKSVEGVNLAPQVANDVKNHQPETAKKKGFGIGSMFKRRKDPPKMEIMHGEDDSTNISQDLNLEYEDLQSPIVTEDLKSRQIEPQQSWIARLFKVKPVQKHICCKVSKRRARQEITAMFKSWTSYGMQDIVVDKERSIVFARVVLPNHFNIKPVSFACEVLSVIEHGKRDPLSIIRITQEKGAASSLTLVADKLSMALLQRGMLITNQTKAGYMIETLSDLKTSR